MAAVMEGDPAAEGQRGYDHTRLERRRWMLRWLLREIGFRFLVKFDRVDGLENFPLSGPAILMINHIAFVDPIVVLGVLPRNIVPMAKIEVYSYPIVGLFPLLGGVLPVRGGGGDPLVPGAQPDALAPARDRSSARPALPVQRSGGATGTGGVAPDDGRGAV